MEQIAPDLKDPQAVSLNKNSLNNTEEESEDENLSESESVEDFIETVKKATETKIEETVSNIEKDPESDVDEDTKKEEQVSHYEVKKFEDVEKLGPKVSYKPQKLTKDKSVMSQMSR